MTLVFLAGFRGPRGAGRDLHILGGAARPAYRRKRRLICSTSCGLFPAYFVRLALLVCAWRVPTAGIALRRLAAVFVRHGDYIGPMPDGRISRPLREDFATELPPVALALTAISNEMVSTPGSWRRAESLVLAKASATSSGDTFRLTADSLVNRAMRTIGLAAYSPLRQMMWYFIREALRRSAGSTLSFTMTVCRTQTKPSMRELSSAFSPWHKALEPSKALR